MHACKSRPMRDEDISPNSCVPVYFPFHLCNLRAFRQVDDRCCGTVPSHEVPPSYSYLFIQKVGSAADTCAGFISPAHLDDRSLIAWKCVARDVQELLNRRGRRHRSADVRVGSTIFTNYWKHRQRGNAWTPSNRNRPENSRCSRRSAKDVRRKSLNVKKMIKCCFSRINFKYLQDFAVPSSIWNTLIKASFSLLHALSRAFYFFGLWNHYYINWRNKEADPGDLMVRPPRLPRIYKI